MTTSNPEGPARATASPRLSRKERVGLFLHRNLDRRLSAFGVWVMRRTRGGLAGLLHVDVLVLTTTGRRSGKERSVVLQYFPDGEAMIVVAANGGGATDPGWYFNLRERPVARVEIKGRSQPVHAEELASPEAERWWARILDRASDYERYRRATDRPFPILRLVPGPI